MPGKSIARCGQYLKDHCKLRNANWKFAICILQFAILSLGMTGCCRWCERHCSAPQATCCQPPANCCQPAYQGQPAVYQAQPAYAAPGCCPAPAGYPAPVGYQPSYSQWQRPAAANGCCE